MRKANMDSNMNKITLPNGQVGVRTKVVWSSSDKQYVVVRGPFPHSMIRSLTSTSLDAACNRPAKSIFAREETTTASFAKTLYKYVVPTENEWGEISP